MSLLKLLWCCHVPSCGLHVRLPLQDCKGCWGGGGGGRGGGGGGTQNMQVSASCLRGWREGKGGNAGTEEALGLVPFSLGAVRGSLAGCGLACHRKSTPLVHLSWSC